MLIEVAELHPTFFRRQLGEVVSAMLQVRRSCNKLASSLHVMLMPHSLLRQLWEAFFNLASHGDSYAGHVNWCGKAW